MKFKLLNLADISICPDVFNPIANLAEVVSLPPTAESLARLPEFNGYFASLHLQLTREYLQPATNLQVIVSPSTGMDHIDRAFAEEKGIRILCLKEETAFLDSVTATAEMTWALLLAVVRKLPWAFTAAKQGTWARDRFRGHQLSGKTLGILGYGRLGRIVAEYGKAFRLRVITHDTRAVTTAPYLEQVDFTTLLQESDILSLHVHLTPENRDLLSFPEFKQMKPGAFLINTSRGAIVNEDALLNALETGMLGGAGLDVIDGEWRQDLDQHPLIQYANTHENLVISPHLGGVTHESQRMTLNFMVKKLKDYLTSSTS